MNESFGKGMFNGHGFGMTDEQYTEQVELLGLEPSTYEGFVKGERARWLAES